MKEPKFKIVKGKNRNGRRIYTVVRDDSDKRNIKGHSHMRSPEEAKYFKNLLDRKVISEDPYLNESTYMVCTKDEIDHMYTEREYEELFGDLPSIEDFVKSSKPKYVNVNRGVAR